MSIKRIFIILLCALLLAGCTRKETEQPAATAATQSETTAPTTEPAETTAPLEDGKEIWNGYEVATATRGAFARKVRTNVYLDYYIKKEILCEFEGAIVKSYTRFMTGNEIKAGDVIATVYFETDDVELARLELEYEHAVDTMERGISNYYQSIASIQGNDQASYLQRLQMEYQLADYQETARAQCDEVLKRLEEYRSRYEEHTIVADCDGLITAVSEELGKGKELPKGEPLLVVADPDSAYYRTGRQNVPREIYTMTVPGQKVEMLIQGEICGATVINVPNLSVQYSEEENAVHPAIQLKIDKPEEVKLISSCLADFVVLELEDVIMIPDKAVQKTNNGDHFVRVVENETIVKRYVLCGPVAGKDICILDGLTEGQQVILD